MGFMRGGASPTGPSARAITLRPVSNCRSSWPVYPAAIPPPPKAYGGSRLIVPAVWDQPRVHVCWPTPLHSLEDWRTYARAIRREVLNAHLLGICPQLVDGGATDRPSCQFQALLVMVYWH